MSVFDMKPTKNTGEGTWENPEEGSHEAALVALIDLGTHAESFKGEAPKEVRKVYLCWELADAPMSGLKMNHMIGQRYTLSLNEKAGLYRMLKAAGVPLVDGQSFALKALLGKPCMVTVNHVKSKTDPEKVFAEFGGFSPVPKALQGKTAKAKQTPFAWEMPTDPAGALDAVKALREKIWLPRVYGKTIPDIIEESKEWGALIRQESAAAQTQPRSSAKAVEQGGLTHSEEGSQIPF